MASLRRRLAPPAIAGFLVLLTCPMALAAWDETTTGNGIHLSASYLRHLAANNAVGSAYDKFKYNAVSLCSEGEPGTIDADVFCTRAVAACTGANAGRGPGPAVYVWRKLVELADGTKVPAAPWERAGWTCFPQLVPGAKNTLTMNDILSAFHDTPFAKPTASIQPVGLKTLVNLPTYYAAAYPTTGFEPGEVDSTIILGFRVDIRPRATSYTYTFGDASTLGPTDDPGGPYPNGSIRHTYTRPGTYPVRIDTEYTGQFRVNGGQWIDIPDTVTIQGTTSQLQVLEAVTRLH